MNERTYERTEQMVRHWWLSLIVGIVAVAIGFIVLVNPAKSYLAFSVWLGVVIFVSGVLSLVQSLSSRNYFVSRGWIIAASIADIIIGLMLMFNIALSAVMMPVLLGIWLFYRGVVLLMQGVDMRSYRVRDAGWVIFGAVLMIIISIAVLWMPMSFGVEVVILFVAIAFITYGVSQISLAFRLYDVHRRAKQLGSER
mgnify:CR=1 FL=1